MTWTSMASVALGLANLCVAKLNLDSWRITHDRRDSAAMYAWLGSAAFWLIRSVVP